MSNNPNKAAEADVKSVLEEAKKTGNLSEDKFFALLNVMMAKEARIAEKEAALEIAIQARDSQRKRDSENYTIAKIESQKACKHLKGGRGRTRGQQRDPAVFAHTFTDGTIVIKCQLCSARWLQGDTDEYLTRNGNKIPNWTNIGWRRAQEMCEDSSNKASSSERFGGNQHTGSTPKNEAGVSIPNLQL